MRKLIRALRDVKNGIMGIVIGTIASLIFHGPLWANWLACYVGLAIGDVWWIRDKS